MKMPTLQGYRTATLFWVGIGLGVWNGVWGDHNFPTFIFAAMFCGFPFVINLDELIHKSPIQLVPPPPDPAPEPVKEATP